MNECRTIGACIVLICFVGMLVLKFIDEKIAKKKQGEELFETDADGWISVDESLPDCKGDMNDFH